MSVGWFIRFCLCGILIEKVEVEKVVSLRWGFLYFKTELLNKMWDFSSYSSILWDRWGFEIQKDLLLSRFSLSTFHFFSSAGQQVGRFDNQFKVMCLGLHPSGPETFLCGGYSSVIKAWDSRCSKVKPISFLSDGFIDTALPTLYALSFGLL